VSRHAPVPTGEATELEGREAWEVLAQHFGADDQATAPLPLDELPAALEVVPIESDRWRSTLRRAATGQGAPRHPGATR
jgi:hypothetical protein